MFRELGTKIDYYIYLIKMAYHNEKYIYRVNGVNVVKYKATYKNYKDIVLNKKV